MIQTIKKSWNYSWNFIVFCLSVIFAIFFTNMYGTYSVYVFLLVFIVWIIIILRFFNLKFYIIFWIIWLVLWFLVAKNNLDNIDKNKNHLTNLTNNYSSKIFIEWEILKLDKVTDNSKWYILKTYKIQNKEVENINLLVYISAWSRVENGQIIKFEQKISKPEKVENFEYDKYLLLKNIYWITNIYNFETAWKNTNYYSNFINNLKIKIEDISSQIYPEKTSGILLWILFWEKTNINKEVINNFNKTWLTHIMAVSGFNITIIIVFLGYLTLFLPSIVRKILITLVVIIFTSIVWDWAPIIRASINWLIWYYFLSSWEKLKSLNLLLLCWVIFIFYKPLSINYDISFYLSYLAVIWIIYLEKPLKKVFFWVPKKLWIQEWLILTLAATITTLPVIVCNFWQLSLVSLITNILIWPVLPFITILGILNILFFMINKFIWIFLWFFVWIFLEYILFVVDFFANLKYSAIKINLWAYNLYFEIIYFIVLLFIILKLNQKNKLISGWEK